MYKTTKIISPLKRAYSGLLSASSCLLLSSPNLLALNTSYFLRGEGPPCPCVPNTHLPLRSELNSYLLRKAFLESFSQIWMLLLQYSSNTLYTQSHKLAKKYVSPSNHKLFESRGDILVFLYPHHLSPVAR